MQPAKRAESLACHARMTAGILPYLTFRGRLSAKAVTADSCINYVGRVFARRRLNAMKIRQLSCSAEDDIQFGSPVHTCIASIEMY